MEKVDKKCIKMEKIKNNSAGEIHPLKTGKF